MKVKDLKPADYNPRTISDGKLSMLGKSLKEFGDLSGVVFNSETGNLVGGHQRLKHLDPEWEIEKTPAKDATGTVAEGYIETPRGRLAYREVSWPLAKELQANIAANQHGGAFDDEGLARLFGRMGKKQDSALIGFEQSAFDKLFRKSGIDAEKDKIEDEVPDAPEIPTTKHGDIWLLGKHRVMCGDATQSEAALRLMNKRKADMIFTDPPYGVSYQDKAIDLNKRMSAGINTMRIPGDDVGLDVVKEIWRLAFENYHASSSDFASYYCTAPQGGDQMMMMMMMMMMIEVNWQVKHELMWLKDSLVLGRADYHYKHEPIIYGWKKKCTHKFYGDRSNTSVWEYPRPKKSDLHPTMKPVDLICHAISNSTLKEELVIDFFLGSGSTLIACEKTGRICHGMEIDPHYCDVIVKRWENFTGQKAVLETRE